MSLYSEHLQLQRRYGAKALKRILKLSVALGFNENRTLVDLKNDEFECVVDSIEINQDKFNQAKQQMAQKQRAKKLQKQRAEQAQQRQENQ